MRVLTQVSERDLVHHDTYWLSAFAVRLHSYGYPPNINIAIV